MKSSVWKACDSFINPKTEIHVYVKLLIEVNIYGNKCLNDIFWRTSK